MAETPNTRDERFLECYELACGAVESPPVLVLLADSLVVVHNGTRNELQLDTSAFHRVKKIAHAPVAVFALLHPARGEAFDAITRERALSLRAYVGSLTSTAEETTLVDDTAAFLDQALRDGKVHPNALARFAFDVSPAIQKVIQRATLLQLTALHSAVELALAALPAAGLSRLQVVVAGDHQARVRSLGMQYFQKRFGEASGADERVTYGEGIMDLDGALALVAKRQLDVTLACAFFGDAKRLQRDVLGDAARDVLARSDLPPIA